MELNRKYKSEAELQMICTRWYNNSYLKDRKRLILIYNNPPNARMGAILKSMGLKAGVADQLYFGRVPVWIEFKIDWNDQSDAQQEFQFMVEFYGMIYVVIRNEIEFQNVIKTYEYGG